MEVLGDHGSTHLVNKTVPDRVLGSRKTSAGFVDTMVANTEGSKGDSENSTPSSSVKMVRYSIITERIHIK